MGDEGDDHQLHEVVDKHAEVTYTEDDDPFDSESDEGAGGGGKQAIGGGAIMGNAQSMGRLGQVRSGGDVAMTPLTRHNVMRQQQEDHRLGFTHSAGSSRETRQQGRNLISMLDAISKKMVNIGVRLAA